MSTSSVPPKPTPPWSSGFGYWSLRLAVKRGDPRAIEVWSKYQQQVKEWQDAQ